MTMTALPKCSPACSASVTPSDRDDHDHPARVNMTDTRVGYGERRTGTHNNEQREREGYANVAPTLQQLLLDPDQRPDVVADIAALVDAEVAEKSGVSGT